MSATASEAAMALTINAEKARIFRITHIDNVPWILRNGLHCMNSDNLDPNFVPIGNRELIEKRGPRTLPIPPRGTLSDYIPFYFTPHSMMMYNIATGYRGVTQVPNDKIVILFARLRSLFSKGVPAVFTDRHAYLRTARFFSSLDDLTEIDWTLLRGRDFRRDPEDPEKTDRYQAETLIYRHLPAEHLAGIVCHGENQTRTLEHMVEEAGMHLPVAAKSSWYF